MNELEAGLHAVLTDGLGEALQRFVAHWPKTPGTIDADPVSVAVTRLLPHLPRAATPSAQGLVDCLIESHSAQVWRQTYTEADFGADFIRNYGFVELVGKRSRLASDQMAAGLLMFGPGQTYPAHRHLAEEIYLPLSGAADYLMPDGSWQRHGPGTIVHNAPMVWHGTQTLDTPVLIAWAWLGSHLTQKSEIA